MILALSLLLIVHTSDLFYAFHKFNPFVPKELVFPQTPVVEFLKSVTGNDRIWGYGTAGVEANFATELGLYSPDGYDPLYPKWYGEFLGSSGGTASRSDAKLAPGFGKQDLIDNTSRLTLLNRLGVKYILDRVENETIPPAHFSKIYETDGWIVYQNTLADGRVTLSGNGLARIDSYSPGRVDITASTNSPDTLVLSDTYYPGWIAIVDGKETEIMQVDSMRSVSVPAGNHTIIFSYEPQSVRLGLAITAISLVLLAVLSWKYEKR